MLPLFLQRYNKSVPYYPITSLLVKIQLLSRKDCCLALYCSFNLLIEHHGAVLAPFSAFSLQNTQLVRFESVIHLTQVVIISSKILNCFVSISLVHGLILSFLFCNRLLREQVAHLCDCVTSYELLSYNGVPKEYVTPLPPSP